MSPRGKKLSEEMRAQSKAAVLSAARKLFAQQSYFNTRITDIANEAGMSHGNVYWYFSGKEDILKAILEDGFEHLGAVLSDAAAGSGPPIEKVDRMIEGLITFTRERGDLALIMLTLFGGGDQPFLSELGFDMEQIGREYIQSISQIVSEAQNQGTIADQVLPEIPAMIFFSLYNGLNLIYGQEWLQIPPEILKSHVYRLLGFQENNPD